MPPGLAGRRKIGPPCHARVSPPVGGSCRTACVYRETAWWRGPTSPPARPPKPPPPIPPATKRGDPIRSSAHPSEIAEWLPPCCFVSPPRFPTYSSHRPAAPFFRPPLGPPKKHSCAVFPWYLRVCAPLMRATFSAVNRAPRGLCPRGGGPRVSAVNGPGWSETGPPEFRPVPQGRSGFGPWGPLPFGGGGGRLVRARRGGPPAPKPRTCRGPPPAEPGPRTDQCPQGVDPHARFPPASAGPSPRLQSHETPGFPTPGWRGHGPPTRPGSDHPPWAGIQPPGLTRPPAQ